MSKQTKYKPTPQGYTLKEGETHTSWMQDLCDTLNNETNVVQYVLNPKSYRPTITARLVGRESLGWITIVFNSTQHKIYGDIAAVNVEADKTFRYYEPQRRMNRQFRVNTEGVTPIQKIHDCIVARFALLDKAYLSEKAEKDRKKDRVAALAKVINHTPISMETYSDGSGGSLKKGDTYFSMTLGVGNVSLRVGKITVPVENVPAFFEAYEALEATLKRKE